MSRFILIALLAFTASGHASITAAWKVPIKNFAPDHESNDQIVKLEKPPGESGFFKPEDELWDVSKTLSTAASWQWGPLEDEGPKLPWTGEWAVWNARSGMLVARGDYIDIIEAQQASGYDLSPRMIRMSFELVRGARKQSVSVLARSGEQGSARVDDIVVETDASTDMTDFHDIRCAFSWNAGQKDVRWGVHTSFVVRDDKRVLIARHGKGDLAWELHATAVGETIGGTPVAETRWIEVGKKRPRPWMEGKMLLPKLTRQPLKDGLFIAAYQVPPPFASSPPPPETPDMEAPATLRGWIHGSFLNVAEKLKSVGIASDQSGFFAGVELRSNQLILVADAASHGRVAPLLTESFAAPHTILQIESRPEFGNCSLLVGSGWKALIVLEKGELGEETHELFQIEPTFAVKNAVVDLNYAYSPLEKPGETIAGTANLKVGEWLEIEDARQPKEQPRFALRATVPDP